MLTGKQRAFLRGLANKTEPILQIGKGGITDTTVKLLNEALEKHEIVKVHVLENSFCDVRDVFHEISLATGAEEVQVIGSKFVLYKQSRENRRIYLDKLIVKEAETSKAQKNTVKPLHKVKKAKAKELKKQNSYFSEFRGTRRTAANRTGGTARRTGGKRSRAQAR